MVFCDFKTEYTDAGTYRHVCRRAGCGVVIETAAPRYRLICRQQPPGVQTAPGEGAEATRSEVATGQKISLVRKAKSLLDAEVRWIAAGCPMRSDGQVQEVFSICRTCEHFQEGRTTIEGTCRICGCALRAAGGLFNKIQMATEGCPAKPPRWHAEPVAEAVA